MDANDDILNYICNCEEEKITPQLEPLYYLLKAFNSIQKPGTVSKKEILLARIQERMKLGRDRYGHGIQVDDDTRQWGTREDSWLEMCEEEVIDGIIYSVAHYLRFSIKNN